MKYYNLIKILSAFTLSCCLCPADVPDNYELLHKVDKIWIGSEKGKIEASAYKEIYTQGNSDFSILVINQQWVKKGERWATISPKLIELERKSLEINRRKTNFELSELKDKNLENNIHLKTKLHEILHNKQKLENFVEQNQLDSKILIKVESSIKELTNQEERIREKLKPENQTTSTDLKRDELTLELEKKEHSYEDLVEISNLRAPFTGRITLHLDSEQIDENMKGNPIRLENNTLLASFIDDKNYNVVLLPLAQNIYTATPEKTSLLINSTESGRLIRAEFSSAQNIKNSNSAQKWIYEIHPDDKEFAMNSTGRTYLIHLFRKLDKPCHVLLKKDILESAPELLKKRGWEGLVTHVWPEAKIAFIGPQAIAIKTSEY